MISSSSNFVINYTDTLIIAQCASIFCPKYSTTVMENLTLWYVLVLGGSEVVDAILVSPCEACREVRYIQVGVREGLGDAFTIGKSG